MPRFAERAHAPPVKKAGTRPAGGPCRPAATRKPALAQTLQLRAAASARAAAETGAASRSGLPEGLKAGVEALSGLAMDDVRVHRNSAEPAKLGALAYAKGSDIHLGPGQERHLPHEAWHVVQQAQGRARPTAQLKGGLSVNDDPALEREADMMGTRALRVAADAPVPPAEPGQTPQPAGKSGASGSLVQLLLDPLYHATNYSGPLTAQYSIAVGHLITDLNQRVDDAYQQSLRWRTLADHGSNFVRQWYNAASNYADNPDQEPRIISARFGYSIEAIACAGLNNSVIRGLTIRTQVAEGHTRPDIVALSPQGEQIAWIDITSAASFGHIRGKDGAGWANRPFVYELLYPQLRLRALLNAMNDPYYSERGALIAGERQIELIVKDAKAKGLRDTLIKLRDDNGWATGSGNAGKKREVTRDAFHIEAASDGVEEESQSMRNTRGALEELGINPGPYGFNRGEIGSTNQRVNELISERAREEIAVAQGHLSSQTTHRILGELTQNVPQRLREGLFEEFWNDPSSRETALSAMALKGVDHDMPLLQTADTQLQGMNPRDGRVRQLALEVTQQLRGPASIDLQTILAWRQQVDPLRQRTRALGEVDQAISALHQYARERNMVFFGRPPAMTDLLEALAVDPPDVAVARQAMQWVHQQLLNEAMDRRWRENERLEQVHDFILFRMDRRDQRVRQLEEDVRNHQDEQPVADIRAIDLWIAQAQALNQRRGALDQVLRATAALQGHAAQQGWNFFNRPVPVTNWLLGLALDPPNIGLAQQVMQWLQQQQQQQQQQGQGQQPQGMEL